MIEDFEKIDETVTDFVASELLKRNIPLDKNKDGSVFEDYYKQTYGGTKL